MSKIAISIIMIIKAIELMITMIIMIYLFILVIIKAMKGFYFFGDHLQFFFLQFIIQDQEYFVLKEKELIINPIIKVIVNFNPAGN